jgi:hypothetical protein
MFTLVTPTRCSLLTSQPVRQQTGSQAITSQDRRVTLASFIAAACRWDVARARTDLRDVRSFSTAERTAADVNGG